jgi:hypothetical protein
MERLTFEGNFCDIAQCRNVPGGSFCEDGACSQKKVWERLKAYEDTRKTPKEVTALGELFDYALKESKTLTEQLTLLKHIRELAEADKDGRVVVLPCQSGEHVFALLDNQTHVWECEVERAVLDGWRKVFAIRPLGRSKDSYYAPFGAFGQTVFLTREAAEKALEAKKDE